MWGWAGTLAVALGSLLTQFARLSSAPSPSLPFSLLTTSRPWTRSSPTLLVPSLFPPPCTPKNIRILPNFTCPIILVPKTNYDVTPIFQTHCVCSITFAPFRKVMIVPIDINGDHRVFIVKIWSGSAGFDQALRVCRQMQLMLLQVAQPRCVPVRNLSLSSVVPGVQSVAFRLDLPRRALLSDQIRNREWPGGRAIGGHADCNRRASSHNKLLHSLPALGEHVSGLSRFRG